MFRRLLKVEVAETPSQHQQGLMFRKKLGEDDGMLFKFHRPQNLGFWGVNTFIPLSIAFVSSDGEIKKIGYISPCSEKVIKSEYECNYAIEANYDFFNRNKVSEGNKVDFVTDKDGNTYIKFR